MKRNMLACIWAGLMLNAAGIMTAHAQNTYVTFSVDMSSNLVNGSFNPPVPGNVGGVPYGGTGSDAVYARGIFDGWASPGLQLFQVGNSSVYTNTVDDNSAQDQSDGNMNWIYDDTQTPGEAQSDYANRMAYLPPGNNASLVLPTAYFGDDGPATTNNITFQVDMSEQIELGAFHPSSGDYVVVAGSYNNFFGTPPPSVVLTNDPNIVITNNNFSPPVIESNVWVGTGAISTDSSRPLATVNCGQEFKYVIEPEGTWDSPQYPNQDPDSGNRFYTMSGDQTLPLVNFNDQPLSLAHATLNVDMSGVVASDPDFLPNSVVVWGTFNSWANGVAMTNNPAAANTNIYSAALDMAEGTTIICQVRYTNSVINSFVYDFLNDEVYNNNVRRIFSFPITPGLITNVPAFYFNDLKVNDYLPTATPVVFSIDMNGAVGNDGHIFDPNSDGLYINGSFVNEGYPQAWYAWQNGINLISQPPGYQMVRVGSTTIFTNTVFVPAGAPAALAYQYGMDPGSVLGGPLQDEGTNHFRVVRTSGPNPYVMPTDTFSTNAPYQEPYFSAANIWGVGNIAGGNLKVGAPVAGNVPVSWLGRPGAHLQSATSLTGPWTDYPNTDGTNWNTGVGTTNGLLSVTNWPSIGNKYFRLVNP
jgi:hypothetical protein